MNSISPTGVMAAYIIERIDERVVVKCPYCHEEHEHPKAGVHWATCRAGSYTTIVRGTGKVVTVQRFG